MALNSINTNIAAYFAQQNIGTANSMTSGSIGRLSSGNRIVRASDDVAAMSVGTSLRTQVTTLKMGLLNANQGSSMLQVADGALSKIQDMLLRQKSLATQATSGSLTSTERGFLNQEFQNLTQEIDRLVQNTNFNGVNLLGGALGNATSLVGTDLQAAALVAGTGVEASTTAVQAFNMSTGVTAAGNTAGLLQFVQSDGVTAIADAEFLTINQSVFGKIGTFKMDSLILNSSARLSVEINGITFSGTVGHDAAGTSMVLSNGNTYIEFGVTAGNLDFSTAASAQAGVNALNSSATGFADVAIMHTTSVAGVNYAGTRLAGVTGNTDTNAPMLRALDPSNTSIKNFAYVSNNGADTNVLSVEVGGEVWYATGVSDLPDTAVISFTNGRQEVLQIDLTGITDAYAPPENIRTNLYGEREEFIAALNKAFSNIGGGVDFALGTSATDKLTVSIGKSDSATLYGNMALNVSTVAEAQIAGSALNTAIANVTSIRANVGAMMSRFDFASANIEISLQNQDAARGTLLDTDIASESSAYATAQVQLQAGIAVLAQANLLPQNLLKLIG